MNEFEQEIRRWIAFALFVLGCLFLWIGCEIRKAPNDPDDDDKA